MRSVTLLLLAILFLGALANTVQRRHYSRRQGKVPNGPPHHGGNNTGGHGANNAPGHEGNNQPHEGGNHKPQDGNHNNGIGNGPETEGPLEGSQTLDEIVDQVCSNITQGCEKEGVVSNHDGQVTDLCDDSFCKEFLPENLCFFECLPKCEQAANKDECANKCMKCGAQGPPPIPLEAIPGMCKEIASGCKSENKTSHKDGTIYDLCEAKHCNEFLPKHQCFFPCVMKCQTSTHDQASSEACGNQCMLCQDVPKDHQNGSSNETESHPEGGAEGEGEGEDEVEGAGEEEGEGEGEVEHEAGEGDQNNSAAKEEGIETETARRIVRLMRQNRKAQPFTQILADARGRAAYRRYAYSVQRRRAPVRRHYTAVRRGRYYQSRSDRFW